MKKNIVAIILVFSLLLSFAACRKLDSESIIVQTKVYIVDEEGVTRDVYNAGTKNKEVYIMNRNNRDGAALLMAMFPEFDKDEEFHETFQAYYVEYAANFPNLDTAAELVGILCDNVYR